MLAQNPRKKILQVLLGFGIALMFLFLAFKDTNWNALIHNVLSVNPMWISLSAVFALLSHFFRALRWKLQLRASGYLPNVFRLFAAVMTGYLANLAIPRAGEIARCGILAKSDKIPVSTSLGTVIVERLFDVLTLLSLTGLVMALEYKRILDFFSMMLAPAEGQGSSFPIGLVVLAGLGLAMALTAWMLRERIARIPQVRKLLGMLEKLWRGAMSIRDMQAPWLFVLYTFCMWGGYTLSTYMALLSMPAFQGIEMNLLYLALIVAVIGGIGMAIPSPGGTGSYHFVVQTLFIALLVAGSPEESSLLGQSFALVIHSVTQILIIILAGAIGYVFLLAAPEVDASTSSQSTLSHILATSSQENTI